MQAISNKNIHDIKELLESKADPNFKKDDVTPLDCIYYSDSPDLTIIKLLLENKSDPNCLNLKKGYSIIHDICIKNKDVEILKLIISHGANINLVDKCNFTALHHLFKNTHPNKEIATVLLDLNPNLLIKNKYDRLFLNIFLDNCMDLDIFEMMLANNKIEGIIKKMFPLHVLCRRKIGIPFLKLLIEKKIASVNSKNPQGNPPIFNLLQSKNFDLNLFHFFRCEGLEMNLINNNHQNMLHQSLYLKSTPLEIIKFFIDNKTDPNIKDTNEKTCFDLIIHHDKKFEIFDFILQNGLHINSICIGSKPILYYACERELFDWVDFLIERGADTSIIVDNNKNLFQFLLEQPSPKKAILEKILSKKDFCLIEQDFLILIDYLNHWFFNLEIFYLLLDKCDLNEKNQKGDTILHHIVASNKYNINIIQYFQKRNFDFDAQNNQGKTILHVASENLSLYHLTQILLLTNSKLDLVDHENKFFFSRLPLTKDISDCIFKTLKIPHYDTNDTKWIEILLNLFKHNQDLEFCESFLGHCTDPSVLSLISQVRKHKRLVYCKLLFQFNQSELEEVFENEILLYNSSFEILQFCIDNNTRINLRSKILKYQSNSALEKIENAKDQKWISILVHSFLYKKSKKFFFFFQKQNIYHFFQRNGPRVL